MKSRVKNFSQKVSKNCQMCVIILMSHGVSGKIEGIDGKYFEEDDLFEMFSDKNCPQLIGKPKMFLFVHCRYFTLQNYSYNLLDRHYDILQYLLIKWNSLNI